MLMLRSMSFHSKCLLLMAFFDIKTISQGKKKKTSLIKAVFYKGSW